MMLLSVRHSRGKVGVMNQRANVHDFMFGNAENGGRRARAREERNVV